MGPLPTHLDFVSLWISSGYTTPVYRQENVNPIEKVERSTLIMASTVHQQPTAAIINQSSFSRVSAASPQLFLKDADWFQRLLRLWMVCDLLEELVQFASICLELGDIRRYTYHEMPKKRTMLGAVPLKPIWSLCFNWNLAFPSGYLEGPTR